MLIPILVVLVAKDMTHGVVVHRPLQPAPLLLLHVTYNANDNNNSNDGDDSNDVVNYRIELVMLPLSKAWSTLLGMECTRN